MLGVLKNVCDFWCGLGSCQRVSDRLVLRLMPLPCVSVVAIVIHYMQCLITKVQSSQLRIHILWFTRKTNEKGRHVIITIKPQWIAACLTPLGPVSYLHFLFPQGNLQQLDDYFLQYVVIRVLFLHLHKSRWLQFCSSPFLKTRHTTGGSGPKLHQLAFAVVSLRFTCAQEHLHRYRIYETYKASVRRKHTHDHACKNTSENVMILRKALRLLGFYDGKALGGIPKLTFCWLLSQMWLYFSSPCLINFVATSIDILWFKNVQNALHKVLHKASLWPDAADAADAIDWWLRQPLACGFKTSDWNTGACGDLLKRVKICQNLMQNIKKLDNFPRLRAFPKADVRPLSQV